MGNGKRNRRPCSQKSLEMVPKSGASEDAKILDFGQSMKIMCNSKKGT